jgi:cytochrome c oxidase cbb3-type subunit 3
MTIGWSVFVLVLTVGNVLAVAWLIRWSQNMSTGEGETTGHVWDGDVVEGNNPLPRWWLGLFWLTIVFGVLFSIAYPSFGDFSLLGWSQQQQYEEEVAAAEAVYGEVFAAFAATPLTELAGDPAALDAGRNLFVNNCATCHGSDARGARGFPNLTDAAWQWGGMPEQIETSITGGRTGVMPGFAAQFEPAAIDELVEYVQQLAGRDVDAERAAAGQMRYQTVCIACHGPTGEGMAVLGGLALNDEIWRYGGGPAAIRESIANGRMGQMPAQAPLLGPDRVHVLAAYVLSLSEEE